MAAKNFRKLFEPYTVKSMTLRNRIVMTPIGTNFAEHTGEVIVDSTGENGTEGDPQEHNRTPQSTAQSAEDGTQASNVQQLDHEQLPLGQNHVVHAVIDLDSGSLTVIGPEGPIHQGAIGEIAADQQCQANEKANHLELSFQKHVFSSEAGAKTFTRLFSLTY